MHWYFVENGDRVGPLDDEKFAARIESGAVVDETLVWNESMPDWAPYGAVRELAQTVGRSLPKTVRRRVRPEPEAAAQPTADAPEPAEAEADAGERSNDMFFDAIGSEFFKIYLKNILLTVVTLGVYRFWAKVQTRRFVYQHSVFYGERFGYHATGREKFSGFLKGMFILLPLLVLLGIIYYAMVHHGAHPELATNVCIYTFAGAMLALRPLIIVGARRFNLSRTSWSGLRFGFDGRTWPLYRIYLRDILLIVVTFGIYADWHRVNTCRFKAEHTQIGGHRFGFDGKGGELFGLTFCGTSFSILTLGFYLPWYVASLKRFYINNLTYKGEPFDSDLTGGELFKVFFLGGLLTVCTFGIGFPWALRMYYEAYVDSITYSGRVNMNDMQGSFDAAATADVEGLGEAGEALEGIGEMFGG